VDSTKQGVSMRDLSIVVPTCNRAALLDKCLMAIAATTHCDYELIVVDGASTDQTPAVLERARQALGERLQVIREEQRQGFVRATNRGFRAATGRHLIWLNDDARPLPGALDSAIDQLHRSEAGTGLLALFHRWDKPKNVAYETRHGHATYRVLHVRGTLYANFAMGLRATYERLGHFDERYYVCAADPDLSLKCWHAGLRVEPAWGAIIEHDEHHDERRAADNARGIEDNNQLFAKWILPEKNPARNDFDPAHPCTLRGMRSAAAPATAAA
jgi:GT2 family glycosyltransferase